MCSRKFLWVVTPVSHFGPKIRQLTFQDVGIVGLPADPGRIRGASSGPVPAPGPGPGKLESQMQLVAARGLHVPRTAEVCPATGKE